MHNYIIPTVDFLGAELAFWYAKNYSKNLIETNYLLNLILPFFFGLATVLFFKVLGVYKIYHRYFGSVESILLAKASAALVPLLMLSQLIISESNYKTLEIILIALIIFGVSTLARILISYFFMSHRNKRLNSYGEHAKNVMIYGAGEAGMQIAAQCNSKSGYVLRGYLDDNNKLQGKYLGGVKVFNPNDAGDFISQLKVKEIFIAIPSLDSKRYKEILKKLTRHKVLVRSLPKLKDLTAGKVGLNDIRNINIEDVLLRDPVEPNKKLLLNKVSQKTVLVTGAGGSIGSELCRIIFNLDPIRILILDNSEISLYRIYSEIKNLIQQEKNCKVEVVPVLCSVADKETIEKIIKIWRPDTIYHAAAYKHVSIVEENLCTGLRNNIWGTLFIAEAAIKYKTSDFILVSTDKAVRPTSAMGVSKRISELILQALADTKISGETKPRFSIVRFGNVLGSSGSVVPLFLEQIKKGGPVTVRHKEITRYFMTITEAAQLVLQASSLASGGEVFVLDMGEPIKIFDLAKTLIELSGNYIRTEETSAEGIEIKFTGLSSGEKLYEELLIGNEPLKTDCPKIMKSNEKFLPLEILHTELRNLDKAFQSYDAKEIYEVLKKIVPEFTPSLQIVDKISTQSHK
jgi:FlaA1/EpsC-like NDP-sugar epimerase